MRRKLLAIVIFLPFQLLAAPQTTPGSVALLSTFECISVRAAFSGDDNGNNSAVIQFRISGSATWLNAYAPTLDRRTSVTIQGVPNANSANINQARGSIVGLASATDYEVQVTWSDPDGVVGSASVINPVSTKTYSPPTGGVTRYIDSNAGFEGDGTVGTPFKTIANAIAVSSPGDTLLVASGSYPPTTITKSGTASAFFVLKASGVGAATITGGAVANSLTLSANYWVIDGLHVAQSQSAGIRISNDAHDIYVQNTVQTNAVSSSGAYTGATLVGRCTNVFLLTNTWATANSTITQSTDGKVNIVDIEGGPSSTVVIAGNAFTGGWDAIGNRGNSSFLGHGENSDFCRNTITDCIDDVVELDGLGPNVRFFDNRVSKRRNGFNNYGGSLLSDAGTYIGPTYVFRNRLFYDVQNVGQGIGVKMGDHSSVGRAFYFHNTILIANGSSNEAISEGAVGPNASANRVFRNNIFQTTGAIYYFGGDNNDHDYNLGWNPTKFYASGWNGTTDYPTFAQFKAGTGQEANGRNADPLLSVELRIPQTSPAVNSGVPLANFNDQNSAWPSSGSAPDMGAVEFIPGARPSSPFSPNILPP